MKTYLFTIALGAFSSAILAGSDPDLKDQYPYNPYDRCMAAYDGSDKASQCDLLK